MSVPLYDHPRLYARWKPDIDAAIARVIASGRLDWGDEVPQFEAEFAAWNGARHAVAMHSGTAALKVALLALEVGAGDEVITVANTDIASSSAIYFTGAKPIWVDIEPVSRTMDVDALAAAINPRTAAIMPVDLFGHPANMKAIMAVAEKNGIPVVEDACLALGAVIDDRKLGTFATVTCFSFAPSKHLGSFGSGGAALTEDQGLRDKMRKLSAYGQDRSRHYAMHSAKGTGGLHHETHGLNERLDEIQAAVLRAKLPYLAETLTERRTQAESYITGLSALPLDLPKTRPGNAHAWRNFVIESDDRDRLGERLAAAGVATALSYAPPMHLQPAFAALGVKHGSLPVTERSCERLVGLPIGPQISPAETAEVIAAVRAALA